MTKTKIEWADRVWNPVTGCSKVSEGCRNCYAERIAQRFWGERKFTDVQCHPERLSQPLHWRKPARVFVNSMSDLFHEDVPDEFIDHVWMRMYMENQHIYIILTKRPERMLECAKRLNIEVARPLKNVWLGVSIEDQATADERIPLLLRTPAARRIVSYEPALGPVDLIEFQPFRRKMEGFRAARGILNGKIDWVIMGGESGPGARPMHPDWARSVRDQCQAAGVPFWFKQWGEWFPNYGKWDQFDHNHIKLDNGLTMHRIGKKCAGHLLDGEEWNEVPE